MNLAIPHPHRVDGYGQTELHNAALIGSLDYAQTLIEQGAQIEARDKLLRTTPLINAVCGNQLHIVNLLINRNVNLDAKNKEGNTPLHFACEQKSYDIAEALVKNGAHSNLANDEELTPLLVAIGQDDSQVVELLLRYPPNGGFPISDLILGLKLAKSRFQQSIADQILAAMQQQSSVNEDHLIKDPATKPKTQDRISLLRQISLATQGTSWQTFQSIEDKDVLSKRIYEVDPNLRCLGAIARSYPHYLESMVQDSNIPNELKCFLRSNHIGDQKFRQQLPPDFDRQHSDLSPSLDAYITRTPTSINLRNMYQLSLWSYSDKSGSWSSTDIGYSWEASIHPTHHYELPEANSLWSPDGKKFIVELKSEVRLYWRKPDGDFAFTKLDLPERSCSEKDNCEVDAFRWSSDSRTIVSQVAREGKDCNHITIYDVKESESGITLRSNTEFPMSKSSDTVSSRFNPKGDLFAYTWMSKGKSGVTVLAKNQAGTWQKLDDYQTDHWHGRVKWLSNGNSFTIEGYASNGYGGIFSIDRLNGKICQENNTRIPSVFGIHSDDGRYLFYAMLGKDSEYYLYVKDLVGTDSTDRLIMKIEQAYSFSKERFHILQVDRDHFLIRAWPTENGIEQPIWNMISLGQDGRFQNQQLDQEMSNGLTILSYEYDIGFISSQNLLTKLSVGDISKLTEVSTDGGMDDTVANFVKKWNESAKTDKEADDLIQELVHSYSTPSQAFTGLLAAMRSITSKAAWQEVSSNAADLNELFYLKPNDSEKTDEDEKSSIADQSTIQEKHEAKDMAAIESATENHSNSDMEVDKVGIKEKSKIAFQPDGPLFEPKKPQLRIRADQIIAVKPFDIPNSQYFMMSPNPKVKFALPDLPAQYQVLPHLDDAHRSLIATLASSRL